MNYSQRGRFFVDALFFAGLDADEGVNLFHRMVVLDVRHNLGWDAREYVALHHQFRPVAVGELTPEYKGVFELGQIHPRWVEVPPLLVYSAGTSQERAK